MLLPCSGAPGEYGGDGWGRVVLRLQETLGLEVHYVHGEVANHASLGVLYQSGHGSSSLMGHGFGPFCGFWVLCWFMGLFVNLEGYLSAYQNGLGHFMGPTKF